MEVIPLGSKEHIIVTVKDRESTLTSLDSAVPRYTVKGRDGSVKYTDQPASSIGMNAYCLVDTVGWSAQEYDLWLKFDNLPEVPIIGPYPFKVE